MNANGGGGKQMLATESGEATSKVDEATQAAWIQDFIVTWRGLPGVARHSCTPPATADVIRGLA